jgi:hypothetical protein
VNEPNPENFPPRRKDAKLGRSFFSFLLGGLGVLARVTSCE